MLGQRITVAATPTLIVEKGNDPSPFLIRLPSGASDVYLGGSDVTTAAGYQWVQTEGPIGAELFGGEALYGIVTAGTQEVHVLRRGS